MTTNTTPTLDPAVLAALAKGAPLDRDALAAHEGQTLAVDQLVRVHGTLAVGRSTTTTQVNKLCPWRLALAALNRLNGASIAAVVREARELTDADTKPLKAQVADAAADLLGTVRQHRHGRLTFNGVIEEV